ncbi:MAG: hypothetical protein A2007_05750 [Verrucomicrobia bacterium GWC2_42_7]|nr:MAG: hypothetical protein A2007_05750 [Verrucomicrobia bacterium GWC2_42_7]
MDVFWKKPIVPQNGFSPSPFPKRSYFATPKSYGFYCREKYLSLFYLFTLTTLFPKSNLKKRSCAEKILQGILLSSNDLLFGGGLGKTAFKKLKAVFPN